jgi:hypothetical protein
MDTEDVLLRFAGDIADGSDPPWDDMPTPGPDDLATIRGLQGIAKVAAAHRVNWSGGSDAHLVDTVGTLKRETQAVRREPATWGDLEILEYLGSGSFGDVYRARDRNLDLIVALKLLTPEKSASQEGSNIVEEACHLAKLSHANVARVYGVERHGGQVGIKMEFVRGENLERRLDRAGTLGRGEIESIGRDLCKALSAVHGAGLLHRDVKAENVMREEGTGRIVLTDFGISEVASSVPNSRSVTGTPRYMAPELFKPEGQATARSDIYSLGVLLFHLATRGYPVSGKSCGDVQRAHQQGRRELLSDLRPDLDASFVEAIEKAIAPVPENRYRTAGEFERTFRRSSPPITQYVIAAAACLIAVLGIGYRASTYNVEASLFRVDGGRRETLLPGATIAPGDHLLLELKASKALHVYVVSYDDAGQQYLLFPMDRSDLKNPLQSEELQRLPGASEGKQLVWTVTSSGGREHIVVIASPSRLEKFEKRIADSKLGRPDYAPITNETLGELRGIGGIAEHASTSETIPSSELFKEVQGLANKPQGIRGPWVRQIDLVYAPVTGPSR